MKKIPRITYGFLSSSAEPINIKIPWQTSEKDGLFKMNYSTVDSIYDNLQCWAKTNKGERVMDADFGLDVRRNLFNPEIVVKDVIKNNARVQLKKYFPTLIVNNLEVVNSSELSGMPENSIKFILEVSPSSKQDIKIKLEEVFRP